MAKPSKGPHRGLGSLHNPMCIRKRDSNEASKGPHRGPGLLHDPMHHKFCSKPPRVFDEIRVPKKATMLKEQQLHEYERMRKVHN